MSLIKYDVFLSFRGEDTRDNFTSHLYDALSQEKVETYIDNRLEKGDEISQALIKAIQYSLISVVIFSENYASSKWCLDEITEILRCKEDGQIVIPVFYKVDPSDVRKQTGSYKEAFAKHEQDLNNSDDKLHKWRNALTHAANLAGWHFRNDRNESELIKGLVEDVLTKLDMGFLPITEFPVGLESRVQEVIEFLESQSSEVCMVGIWGMGGLGKTTTAKAIYNQIRHRFEGKSFIENIREVCEKDSRGHIHLQEQLLSDVIKKKLKKIHSIAAGTTMIQKILPGKRALVVLDDVTTFEQLKALCGNRKWFGQGSVIIITTRDARLLNNNLLKVDYHYKMKEMDQKESLELFSWHAFREASPREDFNELSRSVAAYCGRLPLALEVLGSYLYEREEQEWKSVLSKLETIPDDQVQEKLRISYDGLKDELQKDIFLDICCFFIGKDRAYVTEILNGCELPAYIGITVLIERSLLIVDKNNKLGMHDLLRDMGREVVRVLSIKEPGKRSRLWSPKDVDDVLTNNTGTLTVEGLVLKLQRTGRVRFNANAFKEMKKLRLLQLDSVELVGDYGHLSRKLTWVYWRGCAFQYMPSEFDQGNLVVLDLKYSNIIQVWKEDKLLEKLKILNLSHSRNLENTPDFSKLPNLEKLILKDCPSLREVHQSIGDLSKILLINLKDCTSLSNLPRKIYKLKSLKTLIISGCPKIDKLEEDIVQMESLTTLIAKDTAIQKVPYSIVELKSIVYISLCGYEGPSRDVFPSLIFSWMSPTMNPLSRVSINVQNDNSITGGKDLSKNQVDNSSEQSHTLMEIENPHLKSVCDSIAEVESMLCDSYKLIPMSTHSTISISQIEAPSPNVKAILEKLQTLLETSLEINSSNDEFKQQFHHVLEQLGRFEDEVPVRLHHVICKLKTLIEGFDSRFATAQKIVQDYDQLLQSRSLFAKQLESFKAQEDQIKSKVSELKMQFENINSEIGEQEKETSVLVEDRDRLKKELEYYEAEDSKLKAQVAQWVPEFKNIITALKNSETAYKVAVTNKKKYEDEWAHMKKKFVAANKF